MLKSLNELTEKDYAEIKELAGLFFSSEEVAEMLELKKDEFVAASQLEGHAVFNAFRGGRYQGEIEVRKGIVKMAKAGSTPAQTMAMDLIKKSMVKMM